MSFLVESTLHWCPRTRQKLLPDCDKLPSPTSGSEEKSYWPMLSFKAVMDKVRFKSAKQYLADNTQPRSYKNEDALLLSPTHKCEELKCELIEWQEYQTCHKTYCSPCQQYSLDTASRFTMLKIPHNGILLSYNLTMTTIRSWQC